MCCGWTPSGPTGTCRKESPASCAAVSIAAAEGWSRLVVVTSDFHVTRTRLLFRRCVEQQAPDLDVLYVAGETELLSLRGVWQVATEWPSLLATPWDHQPPCAGEPSF